MYVYVLCFLLRDNIFNLIPKGILEHLNARNFFARSNRARNFDRIKTEMKDFCLHFKMAENLGMRCRPLARAFSTLSGYGGL